MWPPVDGAEMASPRDGRSRPSMLPRSPAPESVSAVEADERLAPPTTELNALAIVANMPRPLAVVPSWLPPAVRCLDRRASALVSMDQLDGPNILLHVYR